MKHNADNRYEDLELEFKDGRIVNALTGEYLTEKDAYIESRDYLDNHWSKMYSNMLMIDNIHLTALDSKIIWYAVQNADENGNINLDIGIKEQLVEDLVKPTKTGNKRYSYFSIKASINEMIKEGVLYFGRHRGRYVLNPKYFAPAKHKKFFNGKKPGDHIVMLKYAIYKIDGKTYEIKNYGLKKK